MLTDNNQVYCYLENGLTENILEAAASKCEGVAAIELSRLEATTQEHVREEHQLNRHSTSAAL